MEIRDFALQILCGETLDEKLAAPSSALSDTSPGEPLRISVPTRPVNLQFARPRTAPNMPAPVAFHDSAKRAVAHHIMANHELQAAEVMAFVLCAFPNAPAEFRIGLTNIIFDEQRHTRMHAERAAALGLSFGDLPVNCYIWKKAQAFESVLDYLAGLPLTFEVRNLDHTLEFEEYFLNAGDKRSAALMRVIHNDEIQHVTFGLHWLRQLKPADQTDWDAYTANLHWPLRPEVARGDNFQRAPRLATGMSEEYVDRLEESKNKGERPA